MFEALNRPDSTKYPHAARWYNHIASYSESFSSLPGTKKDASSYGPDVVETPTEEKKDDDDDVDLFGSDDEEEDEEAERQKAERLAEYRRKKEAKPKVIAKSMVILDVKPWDDTTDLAEMEKFVRSIELDGLVWGASKLVPVGYGINKLQISCVVEDDKVGVGKLCHYICFSFNKKNKLIEFFKILDDLEERITGFEEHVQSVDVAAFNKL